MNRRLALPMRRMIPRALWLLVVAFAETGCFEITATMLPVEGPLSGRRPVPSITVIAERNRRLSFTLPDGETCSGKWSAASTENVTYGAGNLIGQYGSSYLSGYSVSTGSGRNQGLALATCSDGRTFQLDFVSGSTPHGYGIGKDNESNVYRFIF